MLNQNMDIWIIPLIFVAAYMYSSVGHGGASAYLTVMSLFGLGIDEMRSSALILNLIVATIASVQFGTQGHFRWRLFLPFAVTSVPFAYLGARLHIDARVYHMMLGACLLIAAGWLVLRKNNRNVVVRNSSFLLSAAIGAAIGLISGIVGIGGGVILSPVIYLLNWANIKETAAVSAVFILLNSASGLLGIAGNGLVINSHIILWITAACLGGFWGSYFGSVRFNNLVLRTILAVVLAVAGTKLFII